ncbi:MAG: FMN-binding protein [Methylophaga sp.]|nr:FMN-binding protein [Methylophaga sp.]
MIKYRYALRVFIVIGLILSSITVFARGVYQTDQDFLAETFNQIVPKSQVVWVKGELAATITEILGHKYVGLRIRYWRTEQRSVWILEEIGKEKPITFGVVIANEKIETIKVLAFRESRGGEIRHPAFTQQFREARLDTLQLDRHIDGVSGATLSVRAMTDVARMALYLDKFTG